MTGIQVYHDSHDLNYRNPFGAVPEGQEVRIGLDVKSPIKVDEVILRLWREGEGEEQIKMIPASASDLYQSVIMPKKAQILWYYFIIKQQDKLYFYSKNHDGFGGRGLLQWHPGHSFQVTVYKKDYRVPEWLFDSIIYQIFPDRFYNKRKGEIRGKSDKEYIIHNDWGEQPNFRPDYKTGETLNNDFFGGNLEGIIEKLDYLNDLGISTIYLNPIFEAYSNHKYDTGDYLKIDPMFGDLETFRELCSKASQQGINIILDGVFSHTGSDSVYFNKEGSYPALGAFQSRNSAYFPWYRFREHPNNYECWWDMKTLPNVDEMQPSYRDFIIHNKDSVIKHWINNGAKGWRLDVADELPEEFLIGLRGAVKEVDPDAVVIGEVWEDASNKISYGKLREYLLGDELDSVMNYPFRDMLIHYLLEYWDAEKFNRGIMTLYENYPIQSFFSAMNMLGTHDVTRIRTMLSGAPPDHDKTREELAVYKLTDEEMDLGAKRHRLAVLLQMTFPGVPSVYYGDEAGMWGFRDPFNRGTYPWGKEDHEILGWYKKIMGLRNSIDALRTGDYIPILHQGDIYGYIRSIRDGHDVFGQIRNNGCAVIILNRSRDQAHSIGVDLSRFNLRRLKDLLDNQKYQLDENGFLTMTLQPISGSLLYSED